MAFINVDDRAFMLINSSLISFNLFTNIFYACCLICNKQRLKQPLKTLLGCLVWCSILYFVSSVVLHFLLNEEIGFETYIVSWEIVLYYVHSSMTCSVWLNFYYYIQIVPAQRSLLIWVKRNTKSVMYIILLFDGTFILFGSAIFTANAFSRGFTYNNGTWTEHCNDGLYFTSTVCVFSINVHILLCLCTMTGSSFSTAHYLHRHIRSVAQGGGFWSTPRIQSQLRVTITGICQGVLYFLYATFYLFDSFTYMYSLHFYLSAQISLIVTSLYLSGTTVNLGIGQAIFRQSAVDVWKALKALFGVGMVTDDMKMHSSQLTSGEIANTVTFDVQMSG